MQVWSLNGPRGLRGGPKWDGPWRPVMERRARLRRDVYFVAFGRIVGVGLWGLVFGVWVRGLDGLFNDILFDAYMC